MDSNSHTIYLTGKVASDYSGQGYGFSQYHRYVIDNVKDALTLGGQWFLDQSTNPSVLTYLSQPGEDPTSDLIEVPQLPQVLVLYETQYVTFKNLNFAHDNFVVPSPAGFNDTTQLPAAVSFQNTQNVVFDSSTVSQTSGVGLEIISCIRNDKPLGGNSPSWCHGFADSENPSPAGEATVTAGNTIQNSAFWDLGSHGIRIGDDATSLDSTTNVATSNIVRNNIIEGYGRIFPDSEGILQGQGNKNVYDHTEIYDGYKAAIRVRYVGGYEQASGVVPSNIVISNNLVHDLFQGVMNDGGSLYFGVGTQFSSPNPHPNMSPPATPGSGTGNQMLYNVVHDVSDASVWDGDGYGGDGLYVDEWGGGVLIQGNLVYRVSGSGVAFSGPRSAPNQASTVLNNIVAFARTSMITTGDPF